MILAFFLGLSVSARAESGEARQEAPPEQNGISDGGSTEPPGTRGRIKWPEFSYDGGEWELSGPLPFPEAPDLKWGFFAAGRLSIQAMPLESRLGAMTEDRGLDPFDDYLFMIGPRLMISLDDSFRAGFCFDTGLQSREQTVAGEERKADVNMTRLGVILEAQEPLSSFMETQKLPESIFGLKLPISLGSIRVGMAVEMGLGNLNLSLRGDDLDRQRNHNEPFFYFTPMAIASIPTSDWSRLEFQLGYSFLSMNSFSLESYLGDQDLIKGTDFNGFMFGLQLSFGSGEVRRLWPW